jgi:hypothetical protein
LLDLAIRFVLLERGRPPLKHFGDLETEHCAYNEEKYIGDDEVRRHLAAGVVLEGRKTIKDTSNAIT